MRIEVIYDTDFQVPDVFEDIPNEIKHDEKSKNISDLVKLIQQEWDYSESLIGVNDSNLYCIIFAINEDGNVVGGCIVHNFYVIKHYLFISYMIIEKTYRNMGIGSLILDKIKSILHLDHIQDYTSIALYAERWNSNSRRFYENNGFVFHREEEGVYDEEDGIACIYLYPPPDEHDNFL